MCTPLVGDQPFVVLLPDVLIDEASCDPKETDNCLDMVKQFGETGVSQIMVEPVAKETVDQYGIADVNGETLTPGVSLPISEIVENQRLIKRLLIWQ